jgi:hypothetical protein
VMSSAMECSRYYRAHRVRGTNEPSEVRAVGA